MAPGTKALGNLGDSLKQVKNCQLYACTVATGQVQEKKHDCSIVGREFATFVKPKTPLRETK